MHKFNLILIALLISGFSTFAQQKKLVDEVIAVVGSKPILLSSIEAQYSQQQAQGYRGGTQDKCGIFEGMLHQKLLLAQAELDSIEVTEDEVDANLDMRIEQYIRQAGSVEALERYFKKSIIEIKSEFKDVIRDQMIVQRMQGVITSDINITPQDVTEFYETIPKDSLPMIDAEFEIQQIMKRPPVSRAQKEAATKKLNDLRKRVLKGESFATLSILYSEDPGSASNGGELGFVNRADLDPSFADAAFALGEGQVSRVVESEFGMHIIQMIERKNDSQINVRHILLSPKTTADDKQKARNQLDSVAKQIVEKKMTFEEAALLHSDDKDTKKNGGLMVNRYSGTSKFETKHISAEINYALRSMKVGDISQPFEGKDARARGVYLLVKLKSKSKPHVANIDDDYQQIQEIALNFRRQSAVQSWTMDKVKTTFIKMNPKWRKCQFQMKEWLQE